MIISLTGFMGSGKSSVGRKLSQLLCCPFIDLDSVIEERTGRSIPEIFATDGEATFRQMELAALRSIITPEGMVLSLGGGTVITSESAKLVHEQTICIYLRTSVDTLVSRLADEAAGRPLLKATPSEAADSGSRRSALQLRIRSLMSQRASTYERTAHHIIDTDDLSIDEVAEQIMKKCLTTA